MGKKKPKIEVTTYYMSMHFGICHGPLDYISKIVVNEKEAWTGLETDQGDITISQEELFGGEKKEGGVAGTVHYLPGGSTQTIPEAIAAKHGRTTATMPAYRGISSAFFHQGQDQAGFYWSANAPYLPGVWIEAARTPVGLSFGTARIYRDVPTTDNVAFYFAMDTSSSVIGIRLSLLKSSVTGAIDKLESDGRTAVDLHLVSFGDTVKTSIERLAPLDASDFEDIRNWIDGLTSSGTTDFDIGVSEALTFFSTSGKSPVVIFISDNADQGPGDPISGVAAAVATLSGVANVAVYGFRVLGAGSSVINGDIEQLDNTPEDNQAGSGDCPVITNNGPQFLWHSLVSADSTPAFDANPAHIIYECLTNTDWGMGAAASAVDLVSFEGAAATLYDEQFGISMMWTRQSTIESFISEVIDHIEATLFVSPLTGQLTLKLIRDDYSITGLPEFTPDNSVVTNFARKLWGETINEIVVTFTNPENEEEETVVAQDNANIEAQGGIVSDGRNYYGVRVKDLAMRLAQRDLRAASTPLASCDIEVNREAWNLLPGDVVILNSPEDDIVSIVMRVGPVDYGKPGASTVRSSLVEDVFSLAIAEYTVPPDTEWETTSEEPSPADNTLIFTLPYFVAINEVDPTVLADVEYPEVFAGVLASEDGQDTAEFDLFGDIVDAGGNTTVGDLGTKTVASRATLQAALDPETDTLILSFPDRTQGQGPTVGGFMLIEGADETDSEWCLISSFGDSPAGYNLKRGVLDTVPLEWPIGTPVWFVDEGMIFADEEIRSEAETVDYQILTRTSLGRLALSSAPIVSETLTARPHLPLRPANVKVNGDNGFSGEVDVIGVDPIPVTWARRNRLTEDAIVLAWDAADVTPEAGQTTTVTLTDLLGNELFAYTGIAGTSQNVDPGNFGSETEGYIVVTSERDALESLQGYAVHVQVAPGDGFLFEDEEIYTFEDGETKNFED